jgi:hypothetical protein
MGRELPEAPSREADVSVVALFVARKRTRPTFGEGGLRTLRRKPLSGIDGSTETLRWGRGMMGAAQKGLLDFLLKCAAVAVALSVTLPARAQDVPMGGESWKSTCDAQGCSIVGDIAHGEGVPSRHMSIVVALQRGGKAESVTFRLPPDADRGESFAVTFADTVKDASGNWMVKLVPGATRVLNVQDCSAACVVTLPNGIIPARNGANAFDLGQAMTAHNLMLTFYFSHGERIRASAALFRFKAEYEAVRRRLP